LIVTPFPTIFKFKEKEIKLCEREKKQKKKKEFEKENFTILKKIRSNKKDIQS